MNITYQQLGFIADTYIPILFLTSCVILIKEISALGFKPNHQQIRSIILSVVVIFFIMLIDSQLQIWSKIGLDYSTHTALSLVFVIFLSFKGKISLLLSVISMVCYAILMMIQNYHTMADILSTAIVIIPILLFL
ncbi:MAG: hypothetical protein HN826_08855, partial [Methylococcales bacterium]|nr:hypothetical protein [Methylococcales bacterium]